MSNKSGDISISTENIFPIIKKWLYSEKDIFLRELVSNASDAINKISKLSNIGEAAIVLDEPFEIIVSVNKTNKTIKIIDNGIGMTQEEVERYINQIAFSGAQEFLEKYKDKADDSQIIGHFGLGFYSAFMAAEKVQIDTLSFTENATPVRWVSSGGVSYEITDSDRETRGTTITLYMADDSVEFLETHALRETLTKYFSFLPYRIYLKDECAKEDSTPATPEPLNNTNPLWLKQPNECTEEEYKDFYQKVFFDFQEPLFWIHLNIEYPFKLKGILYFPKLRHEFETAEGQIKLFYNQVFVANNIKEVVPEFLMLLKGVLDCPDLPLNVSRSFLQNDGYVNKISSHITKKVADKLESLFKDNRDDYDKYWDDIGPFVKYGCIRESKFFEKVKDIVIFKTINGAHLTLNDCTKENETANPGKIFYVTDEKQQAQYIRIFKEHGLNAIILSTMLDNHFIQFLEGKENDLKFVRIDSDLSDSLKDLSENSADDADQTSQDQKNQLENTFKTALDNSSVKIQFERLKTRSVPAVIIFPEQTRRMQEMSRMFGGFGNMGANGDDQTVLVLNLSNKLVKSLVNLEQNRDDIDINLICQHIYDLAMMSHKQLDANAMSKFIDRNNLLLEKLAGVDGTHTD